MDLLEHVVDPRDSERPQTLEGGGVLFVPVWCLYMTSLLLARVSRIAGPLAGPAYFAGAPSVSTRTLRAALNQVGFKYDMETVCEYNFGIGAHVEALRAESDLWTVDASDRRNDRSQWF